MPSPAASSPVGDTVVVIAGAPDRLSGAAADVMRIVRVRDVIWSTRRVPSDAPVVALVHGAMDRSAAMVLLSRRLDEQYRVLRYDRRGYARSRDAGGPFTIDAHVADLVALLDGRRAVVFGHSYGGNVALALAERHPELVRAVAGVRGAAVVVAVVAGQYRPARRGDAGIAGGCR